MGLLREVLLFLSNIITSVMYSIISNFGFLECVRAHELAQKNSLQMPLFFFQISHKLFIVFLSILHTTENMC